MGAKPASMHECACLCVFWKPHVILGCCNYLYSAGLLLISQVIMAGLILLLFFLLFFPWRGRVDLMRQFIEPPRVILPLTIHMMLTYMALLRIGSAHSNVGAFFCDWWFSSVKYIYIIKVMPGIVKPYQVMYIIPFFLCSNCKLSPTWARIVKAQALVEPIGDHRNQSEQWCRWKVYRNQSRLLLFSSSCEWMVVAVMVDYQFALAGGHKFPVRALLHCLLYIPRVWSVYYKFL